MRGRRVRRNDWQPHCKYGRGRRNRAKQNSRRKDMNDTKIVNIELIAAIEELEAKTAPSGAVTLGD